MSTDHLHLFAWSCTFFTLYNIAMSPNSVTTTATIITFNATTNTTLDATTIYYNQRWTPALKHRPGDRVYLDASDISTT